MSASELVGEDARPRRGLSEKDAAARLAAEGYNELPSSERRTVPRIVLEVMREPMLALLLGAGVVYLVLGDLTEAFILLAFATMSVAITVVQEIRTERVLEALRDLTSPRALVIRDGARKRIAGRDVVRGDLVVLEEGDRVPADAVLVESHDLQTDESQLTGESVPVRKLASAQNGSLPSARPGGDDLPYVFSGSLVVRGSAIGEVLATGASSEIGKIGQSLRTLETEPPRLQAQTRRLVRVFGIVGGAVSVLAVVLYGTLRGGWLDAVLAGIALGMSMLPEEFPVVLTVFMAMGAWRISRGSRPDSPRRSDRVARFCDRAVHGQDGHADRKPDVDQRASTCQRRHLSRTQSGSGEAPGGIPRVGRVRPSGQRTRSLRSDGEGVSRTGP